MTPQVPGPAICIDLGYTGVLLGENDPQRDSVIGDVYRHLGYAAVALGPTDARRPADRLAQSYDGLDAIISGIPETSFDTTLRVGCTTLAPAANGSRVGLLSLGRPTEWTIRQQ